MSAQCQWSSQEWAGMETEKKTPPQSYFQPPNLSVPFPGVYSGAPWCLARPACRNLKIMPFLFAWAKQTHIYWGFLSGLPTSQIYRISEPLRQNGFKTHQFQLWPLGSTQSLDDLENLGCLSYLCYTGSGERSCFNFSFSSFLQPICTEE